MKGSREGLTLVLFLLVSVHKLTFSEKAVIPAEAGIQGSFSKISGCPRIRYGAGSSGPA